MDRITREETTERDISLTVARALSILQLLSRERPEFGITELSRELGLSKSIIHRLGSVAKQPRHFTSFVMPSLEPGIHVADAGTGGSVAGRVEPGHDAEGETAIRLFCNEPLVRTLERYGFVERDPESRRYRVGYGAFRVGNLFLESRIPAREALPAMRGLVANIGHSSQLGVLCGDIMVIVAAVEAPGPIKFTVPVGDYRLGHTSAMGKAGLAALSDEEVSAILKRDGMVPQTPYSITDPEQLMAQLREARRCGYTSNWEENHLGVGSVAAPVPSPRHGQVMAVSLGFPTQLVDRADLPRLGKAVHVAAEEIARRLYGAPEPVELVAAK